MDILHEISLALQKGDDARVGELTRQAIGQELPPKQILDAGLIAGMNVVGEKFRVHEIFLPDVLLAARAMYAGMDEVKPLLLQERNMLLPFVPAFLPGHNIPVPVGP